MVSNSTTIVSEKIQWAHGLRVHTVCPGSSDPPEKILNIFASENGYNIF